MELLAYLLDGFIDSASDFGGLGRESWGFERGMLGESYFI